MRVNSRGGKEEENTMVEGGRSREGPKDATQHPTNGGAQLEAEVLAERQRQANGQQDNQRLSGGEWWGCVKAQRHRLRCRACQMGNTTTTQLRGGGGVAAEAGCCTADGERPILDKAKRQLTVPRRIHTQP